MGPVATHCLLALVVGALAVAVYVPAVDCGYVFDDDVAVTENKDATAKNPLSQLFLDDFWGAFEKRVPCGGGLRCRAV